MRISSLMNGPGPTSYLVPGARVGPSWSRDETMEQEPAYLVRYGLMGHVGRFPLDLGTRLDARIERGQTVVILTDRGVELGEVLVSPASLAANSGAVGGVRSVVLDGSLIDTSKAELDQDPGRPRLLRVAVAADIQDARRSDGLRADRFTLCQRILDEGGWSIDLLDVEPLLDPGTTVLHILGPLDLNLAEIRSAFRSRSDFDVLFELAGSSSGLARVGIEALSIRLRARSRSGGVETAIARMVVVDRQPLLGRCRVRRLRRRSMIRRHRVACHRVMADVRVVECRNGWPASAGRRDEPMRMADDRWQMADGRWQMADGGCRMSSVFCHFS